MIMMVIAGLERGHDHDGHRRPGEDTIMMVIVGLEREHDHDRRRQSVQPNGFVKGAPVTANENLAGAWLLVLGVIR
jgi:hypothetical protein